MSATASCSGCRDGAEYPIGFTMAFHPIVDISNGRVWAYEALVRGLNGESAADILAHVTEKTRYTFDQACRVKAIELAGARLADREARLSINFLPNAVYEPRACIRASLAAAARSGFDPRRLMFEFTENERLDFDHVSNILKQYREMGFITAIDDFGAGFSGLGLLANFPPDLIKLDMDLVRDIATSGNRQIIVKHIVDMARALGIEVIAEGVETAEELAWLQGSGITLYQGYLFAKPSLETFEVVSRKAIDKAKSPKALDPSKADA